MPLKPPFGYIAMPVGIGWIIRARGLAPSIGAGGTIVVAALCCLAFVSALLTFRSWPSAGGGRGEGSLQVRVPEAKAAGRTAARPAPVVAAARVAPAARRSRGSRAGGRSATATPRVRFRGSAPRASAPAAAPVRPAAPAPAPAASAPAASQPTSPAPTGGSDPVVPAPRLPSGGAVGQTVGTVRDAVQQVTRPVPVPPAVQQPVDGALDAVQGVAGTVDGVTGPLLP